MNVAESCEKKKLRKSCNAENTHSGGVSAFIHAVPMFLFNMQQNDPSQFSYQSNLCCPKFQRLSRISFFFSVA